MLGKKVKILPLIMALIIQMSFALPQTIAASGWEKNDDIANADVKIGIVGDSHFTHDMSFVQWFKEAVEGEKTLAGGSIDGLALNGDIVYQSNATTLIPELYVYLMTALEEENVGNGDGKIPFVYAMGNHEYPSDGNASDDVLEASRKLFTEKTGEDTKADKVFGGYHVITAAARSTNGDYTVETEAWLRERIEAAVAEDANKPVFLMLHHPIKGTVLNVGTSCSDEFIAYLKTRPQVINLAAHWHVAAQVPQTIWQDGFTSFQTPLTAGGYLEEWGCDYTQNIYSCHQASMITIKDNVVKIYKLDLVTKELIGEPWVIDVPEMVKGNNAAYLYSADKQANTNKPAYPSDAKIIIEQAAESTNNGIVVKYPNNASVEATGALQDGFIKAYKFELLLNGSVIRSGVYQADFWKPADERCEYYEKTFEGLKGEVEVNVYPMSPFGIFGDPISATYTIKETVPEDAIRYEFENYYPNSSIIRECSLSSSGKLVASTQGGMTGSAYIGRDSGSFSFDIELPKEDIYDIEYTFGKRLNGNLSTLTLYIDGEEIGKNNESYAEDISLGSTYPWVYTPMCKYQKNGVQLGEGKHTVRVEVTAPDVAAQPNLFCMDYLQFVPKNAVIDKGETTIYEFEDHISDFTGCTPSVWSGPSPVSGGKYVWFDYNGSNPTTISFPIKLEEDSACTFEYVASDVCTTEAYLDDAETPFFTTSESGTYLEDSMVGGSWPCFSSPYHRATKFSFKADLEAGNHTVTLKVVPRGSGDSRNVTLCMDYFKITKKAIAAEEPTTYEFEDHVNDFTGGTPSVWDGPSPVSGGKYVYFYYNGSNPAAISFPITLKEAASCSFEYVASETCITEAYLDDAETPFFTTSEGGTYLEDSMVGGNWPCFSSPYHRATRFNFAADIKAGNHTVTLKVVPRGSGDSQNVTICMDYFKITKNPSVTENKKLRYEFEDYAGALKEASGTNASGGKVLYSSWDAHAESSVTLTIPVTFAKSGYYDVEYVADKIPNIFYSKIDIAIDGNVIGTNDNDFTENVTSRYNDVWTDAYPPEICKYVKTVWVDAGTHNVTAVVGKTNDSAFKYVLDYIQFKCTGTFEMKDGSAYAFAAYDGKKTGKAVLALYNGGKLVKIIAVDIDNAEKTRIDTDVSETVTDAKVFAVGDFDNITPLEKAKAYAATK